MKNLQYIGEKDFRQLVETLGKEASEGGKSYILNPSGFANHLITVGNNGEANAERILSKTPPFKGVVVPGIVKIGGFAHDIGKINIGDQYHGIESAYMIATEGESWSLVAGGSKADKKHALKRAALCTLSDWVLEEEMGGDNWPKSALYPDYITEELLEKVEFLRYELTQDSSKLSIANLTSTNSLNHLERKLVCYADLIGDFDSMKKRLDKMIKRYQEQARKLEQEEKEREADYYKTQIRLTRGNLLRFLRIEKEIKELME